MKCAIYHLWASGDHLLYIGCSADPLLRFACHKKFQPWGDLISHMSVEWRDTRADALAAEKAAISSEVPEWNVQHRPNPKHSVGRFYPGFNRKDPATWVRQ